MGLSDDFIKKIKGRDKATDLSMEYEFCPRCDANLRLQKGYDRDVQLWRCAGCGELLINPSMEMDSDVVWICDECGACLNLQDGFDESKEEWICTDCGKVNPINENEVYFSERDYEKAKNSPLQGLSEEDLLELSYYEEVGRIDDREDIKIVRRRDTGEVYVCKFLTTYEPGIYECLKNHPIHNVPRIMATFPGDNGMFVIEEKVNGITLERILENGPLSKREAIRFVRELCEILSKLHGFKPAIIHRDIKPSNVILAEDGAVWLMDLNIAKWHDPKQTDDTRYLGTQDYAAPEQAGFGLLASSPKTDVYALGILFNVMLTGRLPKEQKAEGEVWNIIERCISLDADRRFTAEELAGALCTLEEI